MLPFAHFIWYSTCSPPLLFPLLNPLPSSWVFSSFLLLTSLLLTSLLFSALIVPYHLHHIWCSVYIENVLKLMRSSHRELEKKMQKSPDWVDLWENGRPSGTYKMRVRDSFDVRTMSVELSDSLSLLELNEYAEDLFKTGRWGDLIWVNCFSIISNALFCPFLCLTFLLFVYVPVYLSLCNSTLFFASIPISLSLFLFPSLSVSLALSLSPPLSRALPFFLVSTLPFLPIQSQSLL